MRNIDQLRNLDHGQDPVTRRTKFHTTSSSSDKTLYRHSSMASPTETYTYVPLNESRQEIRLLTLLPGPLEAAPHVLLDIVPWSKGFPSPRRFEALSYTWGSTKNPEKVFVGPEYHPLSVTSNLADALVHLRHPQEPRTLWIDAICVNQSDMPERGSQVKRMAEIYKSAFRVVVWLGPGTEQSAEAMHILRLIASRVIVGRDPPRIKGSRELSPLSPSERYLEDCGDPSKPFNLRMSQADCLGQLLNRSWFERLWIRQEVGFAASTSIIQCGSEFMLWNEFQDAITALMLKFVSFNSVPETRDPEQARWEFVFRLQSIFLLCELKHEHFSSLMNTTMTSKCTDSRDRIYALLSLLDAAGSGLGVEPDYTKCVFEVYKDVALRRLLDASDLEILCGIELQDELSRPKNWSSWVPDWSTPRLTNPLELLFASGSSCPEISHQDHIIRVTGVDIATVVDSCEFAHSNPLNQDAANSTEVNMRITEKKLLRVLTRLCPQRALTSEDIGSLCRTLIAGRFGRDVDPPTSAAISFEDAREALEAWIRMRFQDLPCATATGKWLQYLQSTAGWCAGRAVFKSSTGHFGIAPRTTQKNDKIIVLLGCRSPLVLRPSGSYFQIVGEAYCDGFMNCEALLGPLPMGMQVVPELDFEAGVAYMAYRNTAAGEMQVEDPRLGPLPEGWVKHEHQHDHLVNIYSNTNGDGTPNFQDPRLTAHCLRERGVPLQMFEIV
jgi:hypothetical protein